MSGFDQLFQSQKTFFETGITKDYKWRLNALQRLRRALVVYQQEMLDAAYEDFKRVSQEVLGTEIWYLLREIDYTLKNLKGWYKPSYVSLPLWYYPSRSYVQSEPHGVVLIIAPWNFPYLLVFGPLIHALAAGNCAIIKPSEQAIKQSLVIEKIVQEIFDQSQVAIVQGDKQVAQQLLDLPFNYIFFTGSTAVGKIVYEKAAQQLIPITLELGGKSPAIVCADADIINAAENIVLGKFFNTGQSCIAVDYVVVADVIKNDFIKAMQQAIQKFYGNDPASSAAYARIINKQHYERLKKLLDERTSIMGGDIHDANFYIAPTLIEIQNFNDPLMKEEIFGPLLPIITYTNEAVMIEQIKKLPAPLALYIFAHDMYNAQHLLQKIPSGGACINGTLIQASSDQLPFGGISKSGFGRYHGKYGFDTFSYKRSIVNNRSWFQQKFYPPYNNKIISFFKWWYPK
ncbi:MAG: aldehyde dehydrogenase family protein [Candidatus Babeliaceae bacterium]